MRKPSVHAYRLLGPPKFKCARARPEVAELWRPRGRCDPTPGHSSRGSGPDPSGWSARPGGDRHAPQNPAPLGADEPQAAATPGARGSRGAGWAPGAGRARGGDGAERLGSCAGETGRGRRGEEGWGRRLQIPHAKKARSLVRPHSLTSPVHPAAHGCCPRDSYAKGYRAK